MKFRSLWAKKEPSIRFAGEMQRLTLRPGDVLVVSHFDHISNELAERFKAHLAVIFPGTKVLVLGNGLRLGAVGSGEANELHLSVSNDARKGPALSDLKGVAQSLRRRQ